MTRSKMIDIIWQAIYANEDDHNSNRWHLGEEILTAIEAAGMLPPVIKTIGSGDFEVGCTDAHVKDCKWESEVL